MKGRYEFDSMDEVPEDMRARVRSLDGKLFIQLDDLSGADVKRLAALCDETDPGKRRQLLRAPAAVPANFQLTRAQAKDHDLYRRTAEAAAKVGEHVTVTDESQVVRKKFTLTRSEAKDFATFQRVRAQAEAEGGDFEIVADEELAGAKK